VLRTRVAFLAVVAVVASATVACGGRSGSGRDAASTLEWRACGALECSTLTVPRDFERPEGPTFELALARHRAGGDRRGVLLLNPGGPGASGVDFLNAAIGMFGPQVREAFDLVTWDPRGVGASSAVECGDDLDSFYAVDRSPVGLAELSANVSAARRFTAACAERSGEMLADVSTAATVRDVEAIRAALGVELIDFLGFSYGTVIGAEYVRAYPRRVRAMVLDGAVDLARPYATALGEQAVALERALDRFLDWCGATASCRLGRPTGRTARAAYDALVDRVESAPIRARVGGEPRSLGPGELDIAVAAALYAGEAGYPVLGAALADAAGGSPTGALRLFDAYAGRGRDGRYSGLTAGLYAVGCLDTPAPRSVEGVAAIADAVAVEAPRFGPSTVWLSLPCTFWPERRVVGSGSGRAPTGPRILVVGTTGDPVTPYAWAQSLVKSLGDAHLLTLVGTSHTAYPTGEPCVRRYVDRYLLTLAPPPPGARCPT